MYRIKKDDLYKKDKILAQQHIMAKANENIISGENCTKRIYNMDVVLDGEVGMVVEEERMKALREEQGMATKNLFFAANDKTIQRGGIFAQRNSTPGSKLSLLRDIMEKHAKYFKIENFLAKRKKMAKDDEYIQIQELRELNLKDKKERETEKDRYRKNKLMMQVFYNVNNNRPQWRPWRRKY